jgi:hypothetical protein
VKIIAGESPSVFVGDSMDGRDWQRFLYSGRGGSREQSRFGFSDDTQRDGGTLVFPADEEYTYSTPVSALPDSNIKTIADLWRLHVA